MRGRQEPTVPQAGASRSVAALRAPALAALLLVALGGCLQSPFSQPPSTLEVTCLALDPAAAARIELRLAPDGDEPARVAHAIGAALAAAVANGTGRPHAAVRAIVVPAPEAAADGWNATAVREWARRQDHRDGPALVLHVLLVGGYGAGNATGSVPSGGVVALALDAVAAGAARLQVDKDAVALAVALHHVGHALGQVNDGVPVQARDIQEREDPARHDRDPASVLHAGWEDARTMVWESGATYDAYPASSLADWRGALEPGGVCA